VDVDNPGALTITTCREERMMANPDPAAIAGLELGLAVQDMDRALAFCRDVLGAVPAGEVAHPNVRMIRLRFGNSILKLTQWTPTPTAVNPPGRALGFRYVSFRVDNLLEVVAACETAEVEFRATDSPVTIGHSVSGRVVTFIPGVDCVIVFDPEGNVVEFVQGNAWGDADG
jgi:catechol 2,3-dioxygenase-like lactoylglutathione lyase family enzyme